MPPKIRELIAQLEKAGFRNVGGKGSHRKLKSQGLRRKSHCPATLEMTLWLISKPR
jgi:predicted RNA binding protein YcfA (HicA-like mRNA interferase family)